MGAYAQPCWHCSCWSLPPSSHTHRKSTCHRRLATRAYRSGQRTNRPRKWSTALAPSTAASARAPVADGAATATARATARTAPRRTARSPDSCNYKYYTHNICPSEIGDVLLSVGAIIGIVVGGVVGLCCLGALCLGLIYCLCCRRHG